MSENISDGEKREREIDEELYPTPSAEDLAKDKKRRKKVKKPVESAAVVEDE